MEYHDFKTADTKATDIYKTGPKDCVQIVSAALQNISD